VYRHNPHIDAVPDNVCDDCTAWLKPWQIQHLNTAAFHVRPQKYCIAMPSKADIVSSGANRGVVRFAFNHPKRQCRGTTSKPAICLLQRHHIRTKAVQTPQNAQRVTLAIQANAFTNVPTGERKFIHVQNCGALLLSALLIT
jgi:hypothetical protein